MSDPVDDDSSDWNGYGENSDGEPSWNEQND